ncbi:NAD-dependent epimerase/dehydratase family protein [Sphingomonas fuzhouensis]|uniref:NAD-dependent epimerase/dehydratase family protein n=1 Tax=Sphingomonas fuzhouensis TaxID=3106033 RepID=UPI002AFFC7B5|nr:NAD(P)-dependent oxidoreductase [Sphingomonas sp. SGZ-02]
MLEASIGHDLVASDRHIAITGASGWIGLATLDLLERTLGSDFSSRVSCYGSAARLLDLGAGRTVQQHALTDLETLEAKRISVLHFAFQTKDRAEVMSEADYRGANRAIADTVLAALDKIGAERVFVASSGAATKVNDPTASPAMRLYGQLKCDDENRFADWADLRARRAVIGRIFNITGPYINKHQAYAMASFILDALAGRPITVKAPREVIRSYVAIRELMALIWALLGESTDGVARFDSGGEALELGEVAMIVDQTLGGNGVMRATITDSVADRYIGNGAHYAQLLSKHCIASVSLGQQISETASYIRQQL